MPAQVVREAFYSFADGEAARHIPSAWETIPPEESVAARERGIAASVRRILGDELADSPGLARRRPDHLSRDERAHRGSGDVRRDAHPSGAERPGHPDGILRPTLMRQPDMTATETGAASDASPEARTYRSSPSFGR